MKDVEYVNYLNFREMGRVRISRGFVGTIGTQTACVWVVKMVKSCVQSLIV